ncbi:hypothetical protein [Catelliglobosispora koreensis]|uniref:hypothetical protein n=1 Tax=Catelliglobosispora koreensis TaxID=129052 RepID=UPI000476FD30|nr:hypothetical protein [Catelliglobosispora koreensis]
MDTQTGMLALDPGSITVTTAAELARAHSNPAGTKLCQRCGDPYPCAVLRHAQQVCTLAGVTPQTAPSPIAVASKHSF